jgi:uncharacterized membrane protein
MQIRLLHALLSGAIVAFVLGFYLIPETWQLMNPEPTFEPTNTGMATIGIIASVAIIAITILSFRLVRIIEK